MANTIAYTGTAEVALSNGFGSDYAMLNGNVADFVLLVDTPQAAPATTQRLECLMMMSPRDTSGDPPTLPSDPFHPNAGIGLPALVDSPQTVDLQDEVIARIVSMMASDPGVAVPTPTNEITVTYPNAVTAEIQIGEFEAASGATQALPSIPLSANS
jgi:hypothetical protein